MFPWASGSLEAGLETTQFRRDEILRAVAAGQQPDNNGTLEKLVA